MFPGLFTARRAGRRPAAHPQHLSGTLCPLRPLRCSDLRVLCLLRDLVREPPFGLGFFSTKIDLKKLPMAGPVAGFPRSVLGGSGACGAEREDPPGATRERDFATLAARGETVRYCVSMIPAECASPMSKPPPNQAPFQERQK